MEARQSNSSKCNYHDRSIPGVASIELSSEFQFLKHQHSNQAYFSSTLLRVFMIFSSSQKIIWREFNKKNFPGFEKIKN